jgi:hypothetical protein
VDSTGVGKARLQQNLKPVAKRSVHLALGGLHHFAAEPLWLVYHAQEDLIPL